MTPNPRFPNSKITYAVRDAAVSYLISGAVTRNGTEVPGIAIEFTALGTVTTNVSGVYVQSAPAGYNGTGIPHYSAGSFTPASRVYTNLAGSAGAQDYVLYLAVGTETVLLNRAGAFALNFVVTTTTGYFAVQGEAGEITIHPDGSVLMDFANTFCTVWPCLSATDAFNHGSILTLAAASQQGISAGLDISLLTNLTEITASDCEINDFTVTSASTDLLQISLYNNQLDASAVNALLVAMDSAGASGGSISITGNAAPSGAGITAKNNLIGKGWLVDTD